MREKEVKKTVCSLQSPNFVFIFSPVIAVAVVGSRHLIRADNFETMSIENLEKKKKKKKGVQENAMKCLGCLSAEDIGRG